MKQKKPSPARKKSARAPIVSARGKAAKKKSAPAEQRQNKKEIPVVPKAETPTKADVPPTGARKKRVARSIKNRRAAPKRTGITTPAAPRHRSPAAKVDPESETPKRASERKELTPKPAAPRRKIPLKIPPILLEGDQPEKMDASGPGQRYALGPTPPAEKLKTEGELPESYGTRQLLLTARDPHWLYAHWDLAREQQLALNTVSRDGHLVLRVYFENPGGPLATEVHLHPESRHWFVHVERAGMKYVAELGYYSAAGDWKEISTSSATLAPPDKVSENSVAEFTAIPIELPMAKLLTLVKGAVRENAPLAQALQELRGQGHPELPGLAAARTTAAATTAAAPWPREQERALAEVISMDDVQRVWMGSLEITELIRRQFVRELASLSAAQPAGAQRAPTSPGGISSAGAKAGERSRGFWFHVNAELIVYGATEPDATVTIAGRKITLQPDGSFSYRFALPDGKYELPVVAVSADGTDGRAAEMKFSRATEHRGDVGVSPQEPGLRQPLPENV